MKKCLNQVSLVLALLSFVVLPAQAMSKKDYSYLQNADDREIKGELRSIMSKNQRSLSYKQAKNLMFQRIDNENGEVCCVYSEQYCLRTSKTPNHTKMNAEHTWPQSKGATGIAKSDLHHLFPTVSQINSARSNYPFCEVETLKWEQNGSKVGYNSRGTICFEPPAEHKGNVARAMFYFSVRYNHSIDRDEEAFLRKWHRESPIDAVELERHENVSRHQNNENVFITNPELVDFVSNF